MLNFEEEEFEKNNLFIFTFNEQECPIYPTEATHIIDAWSLSYGYDLYDGKIIEN